MPHPESAWREEIQAHAPRRSDWVELSLQVADLHAWRVALAEDPDTKECLETWEAHIQAHGIGVVIEQATEDGALPDAQEIASRLDGCPAEWKMPFMAFVRSAPEDVRDYLVYAWFCLVQVERTRRTGTPEWRTSAPSGSPEVLRELMFKWGPRHRRHRWSW